MGLRLGWDLNPLESLEPFSTLLDWRNPWNNFSVLGNHCVKSTRCLFSFLPRSLGETLATSCGTSVEKPCSRESVHLSPYFLFTSSLVSKKWVVVVGRRIVCQWRFLFVTRDSPIPKPDRNYRLRKRKRDKATLDSLSDLGSANIFLPFII